MADLDSTDEVLIEFDLNSVGTTLEFAFSAFTGIDFNNIQEVTYGIQPGDSTDLDGNDFAFSPVEIVPEPATNALIVLLALAGFIAWRRP